MVAPHPAAYALAVCGIAGLLDPSRGRRDWNLELTRMAQSLAHRGPDEQRAWHDAALGVGFAFRRLRVVDLSEAAAQPMHSRSGRYTIVLNGEIYNFREWREELARCGAMWRGHGDVETFLELIDQRGLDEALSRAVGMFAFALLDRERRTLTLVRDRLGVKPLVWSRLRDGAIAFASELRALRALPGFDDALDDASVTSFMRFGCIPAPRTIYAAAHKLMPGELVEVSLGDEPRAAEVRPRRWWSPLAALEGSGGALEVGSNAFADAVERTGALLSTATGDRLLSDVPLGAWLSSGVDSSLVCALAQRELGAPLRTFSARVQDPEYDESSGAASIAAHLGTTHTSFAVTGADALSLACELPSLLDEPFGDSSAIPTVLLARATRPHATVVLSGDGGDELFAGYERQSWYARLSRWCGWMPRPARSALATIASLASHPPLSWAASPFMGCLPGGRRSSRSSDRLTLLAAVLREPRWEQIPVLLAQTSMDPAALLTQPRPWQPEAAELLSLCAVAHPSRLSHLSPLRRALLCDLTLGLPNDLLTKVDWSSMQCGLEVRSPLLDHRLYEWSASLQQQALLHGGQSKAILRQLLGRIVPPALIDPRKRGFGVPLAAWMRGDMRQWMDETLSDPSLRAAPMLRADSVRSLWRSHLARRTDAHATLWNAAILVRWLAAQGHSPLG